MIQSEKQINTKQKKPEVSIDAIKQIVKKLKNSGLQKLNHFQLALSLVTIGFKQVCKQFGAKWTQQNQQYALKILQNSQYDLNWYGKVNNRSYAQLLPLTLRGDIQKIKNISSTVDSRNKPELQKFTSTVDNFKRTALHLAVKQNFDVLTEFLINKGFSLNSRDRQLKTPLHYCKSELVCQVLIQKGAIVFVKDFKTCTPAHYAAQLNDSKVLQILLKKSNIVNECDSTLKPPIFYAIFNSSQQQINILRVLIQNGAKVNQIDFQGRTPLHYAAQAGKSRCIPFLLQKGASINIRDKHNKTALDLASNQKVKKILQIYAQNKGLLSQNQQKQKRRQYSKIQSSNKGNISQVNISQKSSINAPIYTKQLNQVSTWVRQKFFVLMKKLQQSGIKANWHLKRPYIYTGSWAQEVQSLQDLYQTFINVNGSQAAMRAFNILCPYQKPLPRVIGKSDQAFQSFFGENWFSNDPIQKIRNMHSQSKIKTQLQIKIKQAEDLKTQLLGYRNQMQTLQTQVSQLQSQLKRYEKIQDDLRKQRVKNTNQYSKILQLMTQKQQLKSQIESLVGGQQTTKLLSHQLQQLKNKNQSLLNQIQIMKAKQAATRRKCGKIFLKSLSQASSGQDSFKLQQDNLFDDDAIINLYDLLKQNPPNLQKRFQKADKKGKGKLTVQQFTNMLQDLSMLPQDVMSMHRITGFAHGRKILSMDEFKTILQNRHKNRPMWQKKLIRKIKTIVTQSNLTIQKLFEMIDKDNSGTIQSNELRIGLQNYNIFMNHTDWCNLFNLLDSDKSGQIDLNQLKLLLFQQKSGKLQNINETNNQQKQELQQKQKQKQEENYQNNQNDIQQNKSQKVSYESRSQIANSILNETQFSQPYQQQDQDQASGIKTINGIFSIQVPKIKVKPKNSDNFKYNQIYLKFQQNDQQYVKLIDLTLEELQVAVQFKKKKFKINQNSDLDVCISAWKQRDPTQDNYLGQVKISLTEILQQQNQWKQSKNKLQAVQFTKDIPKTQLILAIKWTSKTYQEMFEQSQLDQDQQHNNQQQNQNNQDQNQNNQDHQQNNENQQQNKDQQNNKDNQQQNNEDNQQQKNDQNQQQNNLDNDQYDNQDNQQQEN